jgi:hypothetical protein
VRVSEISSLASARTIAAMAAKNKCLAQSNKSRTGEKATKERETDWIGGVPLNDANERVR